MGRYINPKQPKEMWLLDNGLVIPAPYPHFPFKLKEDEIEQYLNLANTILKQLERIGENENYKYFDEWVIVDLINNGKFRAAAVYTNKDEVLKNVKEFLRDTRQHIWFMVKKELAMAEVRDMVDL